MDYESKLARLEHLKEVVDQYNQIKFSSTIDSKQLHEEICRTYGEVADVFDEIVGRNQVVVPRSKSESSYYPNYFEAGYLSGRTIHSHQGKSELLKVIGKLNAMVSNGGSRPLVTGNLGSRVFIVHGHNDAILQSCARFIEKLGLSVTVLREQPNHGRTIIEKFIEYSDVGFAVILLTADDRGGRSNETYEEQKARARQNVIFELGFFIGKLGRERVCALYEEGVEIPSDYQGVAFVPIDIRQAWHFELVKEMKASGLPIDLNMVL